MPQSSFELRDKVVRAGAGAGKTTRLTQEVIDVAHHFLKTHNRFPRLVVTTFTRKATQELRERLILKVCEDHDMALLDYVSSQGQLHISTIHGVLGLFLRRYGHLFEIDNGFKIMSGAEGQNMKRKILREVIFSQARGLKLLEQYSFSQLQVIFHKYSKALIQSPSLGKYDESSLQEMYQQSLKELLTPLLDVISTLEGETEETAWINYAQSVGTWAFESMKASPASGSALLEQFKGLGRKPSFRAEKTSLSTATHDDFKNILATVKKELSNEAYQIENWPSILATHAEIEILAQEFSNRLRQEKKQRGLLEMDDLELFALEAIRKEPEVAKDFANEWDYWLIDEYQDTSPLQVEILKQLSGERPKFIVGDPQQSIYLFRGARSEVFENQQRDLTDKGHQVDELLKNYRSEPELLLFINDFFTQMGNQFRSMVPRSTENLDPKKVVATMVCFEAKSQSELGSTAEKGQQQVDMDTNTHESITESQGVTQHILELHKEGAGWDEICVLARTNSALKDLVPVLRQNGIPTQMHSSSGFLEKQEVRDALNLLKFLVHQKDNENLLTLFRSPWCRILDDEIIEVVKHRPKFYWPEFVSQQKQLSGPSQAVIENLLTWLELCKTKGVTDTFQSALREVGMLDYSYYYDASGQREANLWKLIVRLEDQIRRPKFNFLDFISQQNMELSEEVQEDNKEAVAALEPNRVNLMTIHASKGLQFKHVILPRMGGRPKMASHSPHASLFHWDENLDRWSSPVPLGKELKLTSSPGDRVILKRMDRRELEESDRLLYVALTRAKSSLFLSWTTDVAKNSWIDRLGWKEGIEWQPQGHQSSGQEPPYQIEYKLKHHNFRASEPLDIASAKAPKVPIICEQSSLPDQHISVTAMIRSLDGEDWRGYLNSAPGSDEVDESAKNIVLEHSSSDQPIKKITSENEKSQPSDSEVTDPEATNSIYTPRLLLKQFHANQRGSLLHRLFEVMAKVPNQNLTDLSEAWFGDEHENVLSGINYIKEAVDPPLLQLLKWGKSEWGFQIRTQRGTLEGQVDLWGQLLVDEEGIYYPANSDPTVSSSNLSPVTWVIDYKSGSDRFIKDAQTQLNIYAWALRQFGVDGPIKMAVVYPLRQKSYVSVYEDEKT